MRLLPSLLLPLFFLLAPSLDAQVCDAGAFGSTTADPITITGSWTIGNGCTLDFGDREVILAGTWNVDAATVLAGDLTIQSGAKILGSNLGDLVIQVRASAIHSGSVRIEGKILHNDPNGGGGVYVLADGPIEVLGSGKVEASSTTAASDGGDVELNSGADITIGGAITSVAASGGGQGSGGYIDLIAGGSLVIDKKIDATGGEFDGGVVTLSTASGSITINGKLDLSASADGYGGDLTVEAAQDLDINATILADGGLGTLAYGGGDGGMLDFTAGSWITINADISAQGGRDGFGGDLSFDADLGIHQISGSLQVQDVHNSGSGGTITCFSMGPVTMEGLVDLRGEGSQGFGGMFDVDGRSIQQTGDVRAFAWEGGTILLASDETIEIGGDLRVDGQGSDGIGGEIWMQSGQGDLTFTGPTLNADGAGSAGVGGKITLISGRDLLPDAATFLRASGNATGGGNSGKLDLRGCRVTLPGGFRAYAKGTSVQTTIEVTAGDLLRIAGELQGGTGSIQLSNRLDAPWSPDLSGSLIVPSPTIVHEPSLPPCLGTGFISVTSNSPVHLMQGQVPTVQVDSTPNSPLVVLADWGLSYRSLGALGYLQIDPASGLRLADPGHFGAPIPNSITDANGTWTATGPPLSTNLIGRRIYLEALVEDPAQARNGLFHQAPFIVIRLVN